MLNTKESRRLLMADYKDRIIKERKALNLKIDKVLKVLGEREFHVIDEALLRLQLEHMIDYRDVLTERLNRASL